MDEDFDLDTDPHNCGACGHACQLPNARALCIGGTCVLDVCEDFFHDDDVSDANGCERELPAERLRVDPLGPNDPMNGRFTTVTAAVLAAGEGDIIDVAAGEHPEVLVLNVSHLTVRGAGRERTVIVGSGDHFAALTLSSPHTRPEAVAVDAAGLHIRAARGSRIRPRRDLDCLSGSAWSRERSGGNPALRSTRSGTTSNAFGIGVTWSILAPADV